MVTRFCSNNFGDPRSSFLQFYHKHWRLSWDPNSTSNSTVFLLLSTKY